MRQTHTVTTVLTTEAVSLHNTSKALTLGVRASINKLAFLEPAGLNARTNGEETGLILDTELENVTLGREAIHGEVTEERLGNIIGVLPASTNLDSVVSVSLTGLVGEYFDTVELQDGAGDALASFGVEDGGHALLDCDGTGAEREGEGLAAESRCRRRLENGQAGANVEAAGLGGIERSDTECPHRDMGRNQCIPDW
jgi:hypothetical protein